MVENKMKFYKIHGGNESDVYVKFPWLKKAKFEDAVVDITQNYLIWYGGIWRSGTWECGFWYGGVFYGEVWKDGFWNNGFWYGDVWENGLWKSGFWEKGIWKSGLRWNSSLGKYIKVILDYRSYEYCDHQDGIWKYEAYATYFDCNYRDDLLEYEAYRNKNRLK
jgi:hypothetical protein